MVKRQKEKQYQSAIEHRQNSKIRAGTSNSTSGTVRRLPFNCCALTLTPFADPVCTPQGIIFDNAAILPYLLRHKSDPVTGQSMTSRELITLNMDKDEEGRWQCPVLGKPFGDHTKVVAIRQSQGPGGEAMVYSYEAVQELNFKAKNYEDLTTGKKFHKTRDVLTLQDPNDAEHNKLRDINNFVHVSQLRSEEKTRRDEAKGSGDVRHSVTASRIMEKIAARKREEEEKDVARKKKKRRLDQERATDGDANRAGKVYTDDLSGVEMTSGKCSGSLTSTVMSIANDNDAREATDEEVLRANFDAMKRLKKKGYVRLHTNLGDVGLELHCDIAPRTTTNFLGLAESGKYDGTVFHRSIRNFMIQGGKPSKGTEKETSLWGDPFVDEFDDRLSHTGGGVVSMANAGPGTNKRQFFVTYKSCTHLDRKHSIFGKVVKGMDVLKAMEAVATDKKDRPKSEIKILEVEVLENPVKEAEELVRTRIRERAEEKRRDQEERRASALGRTVQHSSEGRKGNRPQASQKASEPSSAQSSFGGVGKYLPKGSLHNLEDPTDASGGGVRGAKRRTKSDSRTTDPSPVVPSRLPPPPKKTTFGDFSGW